jgi:hypothetical protein
MGDLGRVVILAREQEDLSRDRHLSFGQGLRGAFSLLSEPSVVRVLSI